MNHALRIWLLAGAVAVQTAAAGAMELGADRPGFEAARETWHPPREQSADDAAALARLLGIEPSASPLESQLLADAADGRLDQWTLPQAALVAGGVRDRETLARYGTQLEQWSALARAADRKQDSPRRRAAALLELMHARLMPAGYQLDATDLTAVLDRGQFNCVSATLLYIWLAEDIGLTATAVELPTHAFCRVTAGGESFDVEPTCRRWFEVIDDPAARAAVTRHIAGVQGLPGTSLSEGARGIAAQPRVVSPAQLLAVFYYNRGVDLIRRGDDAGAIAANLRAMSLDPDSAPARGNLWVAVNNAALAHCRDSRFAQGADLIARARQVVPQHAALTANQLYIYQQWAADLCRRGQLAEALEVLNSALEQHPGQLLLTNRRDEVERRLKLSPPLGQPASLSKP